MASKSELIVIGGGLVGLATAYKHLVKKPSSSVTLLEKDNQVAQHQSSHNSGVLHSGIYYKPGSLKALNCILGKAMMEQFCAEHDVGCKRVTKLIVATNDKEVAGLEEIFRRGTANGIPCEMISGEQSKEIEPHVSAHRAISVKSAGVCDFPAVAQALMREIRRLGGAVVCNAKVVAIQRTGDSTVFTTTAGEFTAARFVNTSGLFSDRVMALTPEKPAAQIVPFRGEYYILRPERDYLCKSLVYPVPNPEFPFLGVHFTRGISGEVECGPNAVLALAREGYSWSNINPRDIIESLSYRGFQRFALRYWREGFAEIARSLSRRRFLAALQALIPEITDEDLLPGPTGVRAQAISLEGRSVDDFLIQSSAHGVHVLNAPSPAATSCLSIGESVVGMLE